MKGPENFGVDSGPWLDIILRTLARVGGRIDAFLERRRVARREAAAVKAGTEVIVTGECCGRRYVGRRACIKEYIEEADDYRVCYPALPTHQEQIARWGDCFGCGYLCRNGFEVLP